MANRIGTDVRAMTGKADDMRDRFVTQFNNLPLKHARRTLVDREVTEDASSQEIYDSLFHDTTDKRQKLFAWAADKAGCGYYRVHQPIAALNAANENFHGVAYNYDQFKVPVWSDREVDSVVLAQRIANRVTSVIWHALADRDRAMVMELDDDLWNVPRSDESRSSSYEFWSDPEHQYLLTENIRRATMLTVSTNGLANSVADIVGGGNNYCPPIYVVPNAVPDKWFKRKRNISPVSEAGGVTIGWAGSSTHELDFSTIRDQLRRFMNREFNVEMHIMGTNYGDWMKLPQENIRFTDWFDSVDDYHMGIDFDVCVIPLMANRFNRAKSNIKFLEMATRGIPCLAADIGPYSETIEHGVNGLLYKTDYEFYRLLRDLVHDEAMRHELGANARKTAAEFKMSKVVKRWQQVLAVGAGMNFDG